MLGKPWTCAMTDAHVDEALLGELSPLLQRGFGVHRRACARCRTVVDEAVHTVGALRAWPLESPGPDFAPRVLAARREAVAAPRLSWLRAAQATVIWAVCLTVALISGIAALWPGVLETPGAYALEALNGGAQTLHAVLVAGSVAAGAVGVAAWIGISVGVVVFYAAAIAGLRTFLLRRPT